MASSTTGVPDVNALLNEGARAHGEGRIDDAVRAFEAAWRLEPKHPRTGLNLAIALIDAGRAKAARDVLSFIVDVGVGGAIAWVALAEAERALGDMERARTAALSALATDGNNIEAQLMLGHLAYVMGDFNDALKRFTRVTEIAPDRPEAWMNLGILAQGVRNLEAAISAGVAAAERAPNDPLVRTNLAMTRLLAGDFATGLQELSTWRAFDPVIAVQDAYRDRLPRWDGAPLDGPLLVALEQGAGDYILWSRLFGLAAERTTQLVVETPDSLRPLYTGRFGSVEFCGPRVEPERVPAFAAYVRLCDLGSILALQAPYTPDAPYLEANPERVAQYVQRFAALGGTRVVGVAWAGDPVHGLDQFRSMPYRLLSPLLDNDQIVWVSIQKGPRAADAADDARILTLGDELTDYAETAAVMGALDALVTVDTSVAHLAGALGVPGFVMHGFGGYWLWGAAGERSEWYPSLYMVRQTRANVWDEPLVEVDGLLRRLP